MTVRAKILLKDRTIKVKKLNQKKSWFRFRDGIYALDRRMVNNVNIEDNIIDSEIYYFEGNPNPVSPFKLKAKDKDGNEIEIKDRSIDFLGELVIENVIEQTSMGPAFNLGAIFEKLRWFTDLRNLTMIMLILTLLYGIIVGGIF